MGTALYSLPLHTIHATSPSLYTLHSMELSGKHISIVVVILVLLLYELLWHINEGNCVHIMLIVYDGGN